MIVFASLLANSPTLDSCSLATMTVVVSLMQENDKHIALICALLTKVIARMIAAGASLAVVSGSSNRRLDVDL